MPTREEVTNTIIPQKEVAPIPERTVVTRAPKITATQNGNQQTTTVNTAAAESATTEESVKLSPQVSAIARKEQAQRQRERIVAQREKDLADRLAKADQYDQLQAKLQAKDYSAVEQLGLEYNDFAKYKVDQLNGEDPNTKSLQELRAELDGIKKEQEETKEEQFKETVAAYRKELISVAESKPEFLKVKKFEEEDDNGNTFTGIDVALKLILDAWEKDGEELTVDEALADTEMLIRERAKKMAALIDEPTPAESTGRQLPPPKRGVSTLTNDMQPSGNIPKPNVSLRSLPDEERYKEARRRVMARRNQQGA